MSRKLPHHSNLVTSYLKPHLPKKWILKIYIIYQIKNLQN